MEIVRAINYVDSVVPQENMDKLEMWRKLKFDIMFVGDDWFDTPKWELIEENLKKSVFELYIFHILKGYHQPY